MPLKWCSAPRLMSMPQSNYESLHRAECLPLPELSSCVAKPEVIIAAIYLRDCGYRDEEWWDTPRFAELLSYCEKNGWSIEARDESGGYLNIWYVDNSHLPERPEFQRMMRDAAAGRFNMLLFVSTNNLCPSEQECAKTLDSLRNHKVKWCELASVLPMHNYSS